jgi:mRNA interferase MazF
MARILRGDIRWANLNPVKGKEQTGVRPVLVISHDVFNERSGAVIALALRNRNLKGVLKITPSKIPVKNMLRTFNSGRAIPGTSS